MWNVVSDFEFLFGRIRPELEGIAIEAKEKEGVWSAESCLDSGTSS
jgi:hypothetical protein